MSSDHITNRPDHFPDRRQPEADEDFPREYGVPSQDRTMALLSHFGGYFTNFLIPLVLYLSAKGRSPFVDYHNREALNFQITQLLYFFLLTLADVLLLLLIGVANGWKTALVLALIAFMIPAALFAIFELVVTILACIAAHRGRLFRYPLCIRLVKRPRGVTSKPSTR